MPMMEIDIEGEFLKITEEAGGTKTVCYMNKEQAKVMLDLIRLHAFQHPGDTQGRRIYIPKIE